MWVKTPLRESTRVNCPMLAKAVLAKKKKMKKTSTLWPESEERRANIFS